MSAQLLDGRKVAAEVKAQVKKEAEAFYARNGRKMGLAVILVGDNFASGVYVNNKIAACNENCIKSFSYKLPESTTEEELIELIHKLNANTMVDGILVQLPLPPHIRPSVVLPHISVDKDADGFLAENAGNLMLGIPSLNACTPAGIIELLHSTGRKIDGANAVVIGRSNIVGKPIALMLLQNNATVTICHSHTENLTDFTHNADILVVAVGKKHVVNGDMIKKGAIVIDVGMHREDGKLCGDVDFESAREVAGYITPVPGGVGPMTIAMLLKNIVKAALRLE
ncbi:MAG: bifunctional methylenetetrahydrofolate dehydrogenase/methenyltetrahydrofolate cyclohydrolase FolD [Clostridiales bacterium]|nr:bifunctional methylenetetrahydrofolate dehydrogenase/methenyltetrahydrofolate cyclohydrolase FolD [Clostridiales bacterium]